MWPEILPPFVIIVGSLYLTSFLIGQIDKYEYGGKPRRYNVDKWDERMLARDLRITGKPRHQKAL